MPTLNHSEKTRFTTRQIFDLVAAVDRYPEFIPWCKAARIVTPPENNQFEAELIVVFKGLTERYTSRVTLTSPQEENGQAEILAEMTKGPFHHLRNQWLLTPCEGGGCQIELDLDFRFKSRILDAMIGSVFGRASEKMVGAFRARARELYTPPETEDSTVI